MNINTRRTFFSKIAAMAAVMAAAPKLFAQQPAMQQPSGAQKQAGASGATADDRRHRSSHTHNGIYYISGTGANDGYGKDDHVLVTDPLRNM